MTRLTKLMLLLVMAFGATLAFSPTAFAEEEEPTPLTKEQLQAAVDELNKVAADEDFADDGKPAFEVTLVETPAEEEGGEPTYSLEVAGVNGGADYSFSVMTTETEDGKIASVDGVEMNLPFDFWVSNLWVMIAAFLVFIMHLGFAMVESGFTRAKNTVNILFKNTMIPMIGLVMYAVCGWLIMYPGDNWIIEGVFAFGLGIGGGAKGSNDWISNLANNSPFYNAGYTVWTDFVFQGMFAATAATIVSGAVAGRVKLLPFLIFSTIFVGISYPITGSWHWGGGWLKQMGFEDFAGSTLVHAVGGAGALVGAIILGPRLGKYGKDGAMSPIPGHSMPLGTIGVFLLWFGWFGFNGGSELSANPEGFTWVIATTVMAACGGGLAAAITSWIVGGKPDLSMALNGILAGLVGITACCHLMNWVEATFLVGAVAGVLCYFAVLFFDKMKIDDPVGAISVHGVCGIYGTLCAGLWGTSGLITTGSASQLIVQATGTFTIFIFTAVVAAVLFSILKATLGLRVSEEEEIEGLDLGEHDMSAYPDFQRTYIKSYHAREM